MKTGWPAALLLVSSAALSAQTKDQAPVALQSSEMMTQDKPKSESWTYIKPKVSVAKYNAVLIRPTQVYKGPDAQFNGIDDSARQKYAEIVTAALRSELGKSFGIVSQPKPGALDVRVTILGAEKTTQGVATASRVTTIGLATSAVKSLAGKPGTMTGSLLLAVEIKDAKTGELLAAAVRRQSPDALDIPATLSTTDTVKAVARDFSKKLRGKLDEAKKRPL